MIDTGNPAHSQTTQGVFVSFGGPDVLDMVTMAARAALTGAKRALEDATAAGASPESIAARAAERDGAAGEMQELLAQLEGAGLYADEARAMVDTWRREWFGDEGLRLLYLAPRALVDA